jgi:hypothetical protein
MIRKEISKYEIEMFSKNKTNLGLRYKKYACHEMQPIMLFENFLLLSK